MHWHAGSFSKCDTLVIVVLMKPENAQVKAQIELCCHVNGYVCTPI